MSNEFTDGAMEGYLKEQINGLKIVEQTLG